MNYKGAVFFDNDGTLTDEPRGIGDITPKTAESLRQLKDNGYLSVLATGRAACYAGHILKYFDCVVLTNGTYVSLNGKCISDNPIDSDILEQTVEYMDQNGVCYVLDNQDVCCVKDCSDPLFNGWINRFNITREPMTDDPKYRHLDFYKINVMYPNAKVLEDMRQKFDSVYKIDIHPGCLYGDATLRKFNKGTGAKQVIEKLNIPFENTYAFGDGENDIDMFKVVNTATVMGNHSPSLDGCGYYETRSVADDGIYFALKEYGLVK